MLKNHAENNVERKVIKTGADNSTEDVNQPDSKENLQNTIALARLEQQKISKLINMFFIGMFLAYLLYLY